MLVTTVSRSIDRAFSRGNFISDECNVAFVNDFTAASTGLSAPHATESGTSAKRGSTASHSAKLLAPRISFTDDTIGKQARAFTAWNSTRRMESSVYRKMRLETFRPFPFISGEYRFS